MTQYVAFLRGINVGGHHKVPMTDLRLELEKLNFKNVVTFLNSGNILFETTESDLENKISAFLEKRFGFPVSVMIRKAETIVSLVKKDPFKLLEVTKEHRLYVTFLRKEADSNLSLPWGSLGNSFRIIGKEENIVFSVLDLSEAKTTKAMEVLEKFYGKDITTRNWNTIERIAKKAAAQEKAEPPRKIPP